MSYTLSTPVIGGQQAYEDVPDSYAGAPTPALIYLHGATENGSEISTGANGKVGVRDAFRAKLWINCGINAYGDGWGNPPSLGSYLALIAHVQANFNVSDILFFSQSMGGMPGLLLVASGAVPLLRAWAGVSPVCSLRSIWNAGGTLATQIETAYGISPAGDLASYLAQTAGHDPLLIDPAAYSGVPLRFYASQDNEDGTVSSPLNTVAFQAAVASSSRFINGVRLAPGDHTAPPLFQSADLVDYYVKAMAGQAPRRRLHTHVGAFRA